MAIIPHSAQDAPRPFCLGHFGSGKQRRGAGACTGEIHIPATPVPVLTPRHAATSLATRIAAPVEPRLPDRVGGVKAQTIAALSRRRRGAAATRSSSVLGQLRSGDCPGQFPVPAHCPPGMGGGGTTSCVRSLYVNVSMSNCFIFGVSRFQFVRLRFHFCSHKLSKQRDIGNRRMQVLKTKRSSSYLRGVGGEDRRIANVCQDVDFL